MKLHFSLAMLLLLAACAPARAPAPVEYRGVGTGVDRGVAASSDFPAPVTPAPIYGEGYQPPASTGSIQMQELPPPGSPINPNSVSSTPLSTGEPDDAYAQAARQILPAAPPAASSTILTPTEQGTLSAPSPAATGTGQFGWPLRGKLLSSYGPKGNGQTNDGLNIAAPLGTAVVAAKDGTVAYAGSELRNFGNMVLLRHTGGLFTVYAHLDQIMVRKEQTVKRGQNIGTVGTSGGVKEPQLHFEIRKDSKPLDPRPYLGE